MHILAPCILCSIRVDVLLLLISESVQRLKSIEVTQPLNEEIEATQTKWGGGAVVCSQLGVNVELKPTTEYFLGDFGRFQLTTPPLPRYQSRADNYAWPS